MASTILTPGTIFLLIVGALSAAFPEIPLFGSLILNLIPVAVFVLLCFVAKTKWQVSLQSLPNHHSEHLGHRGPTSVWGKWIGSPMAMMHYYWLISVFSIFKLLQYI